MAMASSKNVRFIFCIGIMFVGCLGQNPIRLQSYEKIMTIANKRRDFLSVDKIVVCFS
jgi:hypothetical protein